MNIILPCAGLGSRFKEFGYTNPKPIIDVLGKPMIEWVISNVKPKEDARFIFLFLQEHLNHFPIKDDDKKWSYAKTNPDGLVIEVAEKQVISEWASTGIYYYRKGSDLFKYINEMISSNIRTNNEFYLMPAYQQFIKSGKIVKIYPQTFEKNWGLGTPGDLDYFLKNYRQ